ncbi:hypothetical protein RHECNPAF_2330044 [Rhizobium etli CNPAF512]|nr:hypothetical protein RHECNPAF_2330044 [Rhizobium etli CNPAF512]
MLSVASQWGYFQALLPSVSRINQTIPFLSFSTTSATEIIGNQGLPRHLSIRSR